MTSSGLEWDYYEFQPTAPGAKSVLFPANPINSQWSSNGISDWSMSNHMTPTPEIVQDPVATVKSMKEDKHKRKQRRKARKDPRRSEGEEVSTCFVCLPGGGFAYNRMFAWVPGGFLPKWVTPPLHDWGFSYELGFGTVNAFHYIGNGNISVSEQRFRPQGCNALE